MRILSIDSSLGTQLAVVDIDEAAEDASTAETSQTAGRLGAGAPRVLSQAEQADTRRHAESLGQMLSEALSAPDVAERPLDAVVAATGPAPFTGLRAGLVTARVVGRTRGIPVHGVSSLDAVARRALDELGAEGEADPVVLVATDARRREVYAALFRANGPDDVTRLTEIDVCPPAQVAGRLDEVGVVDAVAGSGAALYPELAELASSREVLAPVSGDALTQVRVALARLGRGEELGTQPLYLRHADVQMPAARKRVR
ncbi:tRNA (adenosine(37)-N6)-threonylcarbamoyltransferase complex dimerization subunit type 1 TsaB [Actinomyces sp. ZJ308]|uniref:tRNA (adenosine(37)-N6)-threonylcarbamoyltransferase complex dimerization subunit type 1 TsaB n=1 Tax=Actinomyces sp. ZJ308 TaxID=2708342 RepID=UPI00141EDE61|nr:tRNA (adenosine(37)-N6)-threonylcarbamoyltransferase complex dimerization subunit type 1 TsaB [Actinomyces sp. ZJ308]